MDRRVLVMEGMVEDRRKVENRAGVVVTDRSREGGRGVLTMLLHTPYVC